MLKECFLLEERKYEVLVGNSMIVDQFSKRLFSSLVFKLDIDVVKNLLRPEFFLKVLFFHLVQLN